MGVPVAGVVLIEPFDQLVNELRIRPVSGDLEGPALGTPVSDGRRDSLLDGAEAVEQGDMRVPSFGTMCTTVTAFPSRSD